MAPERIGPAGAAGFFCFLGLISGRSATVIQPAMGFSASDLVPIDAARLHDHHRLERERFHLLPMADAQRGLADIAAGRTVEADAALAQLQQRRTAACPPAHPATNTGPRTPWKLG